MQETIQEKLIIEDMIFEVRGKQVMIDSDLAKLYKCANGTKTINQAVKRHINRFPIRFRFQLSKEEHLSILRSQFGTLELNQGKYTKYLPYVFTEEGVAMLATILKTSVAEQVSIQIMDAFVAMRKYISTNLIEQKYINNQIMKNTENIKLLQKSFSKFEEKRKVNEIYFEGQIWDSYSKILDIFRSCKQELIIIDAYADKMTLDLIKNLNIQVTLIVKVKSLLTNLEIEKYQEQYHNLEVIYNNTFHDRYFIIDANTIYHCGTSLNHLGSKTFSINLLEDEVVKTSLINKVNSLLSKQKE